MHKERIGESLRHLEYAAEIDSGLPKYTLGIAYLEADIVKKNVDNGLLILNESADSGYERSALKLGEFYYLGKFLDRDKKKAMSLFCRFCDIGQAVLSRVSRGRDTCGKAGGE
jgi:TPR repeat protein